MKSVRKPWIAFKILAAGAIPPRDGFSYAFRSGADFVAVGMFDFQIKSNCELINRIVKHKERARPWYSRRFGRRSVREGKGEGWKKGKPRDLGLGTRESGPEAFRFFLRLPPSPFRLSFSIPAASEQPVEKGTGSEPRGGRTRENNGSEVPVPLLQRAARAAT